MENGPSATTTHWELLILLCFLTDSAQHIEAAEGYYGFFLGGLGDSGTDTILYSFANGGGFPENLQCLCQICSRESTGVIGSDSNEPGDVGGSRG